MKKMKKIFHFYTLLVFVLLVLLASCKKVYESVPLGQQIPENIAFDPHDSAGVYALRFLLTTYAEALPNNHNRINGNYLDAASDDPAAHSHILFYRTPTAPVKQIREAYRSEIFFSSFSF